MKLPFSLMPGSWGLKGVTREIAEAEYYLDGYELEVKLVEIKHKDLYTNSIELNKIEKKYGRMTDYEYDKDLNTIEFNCGNIDELTFQRKSIDVDLKHNKIDQYAADQRYADLEYDPDDKDAIDLARLEIDHKHNKIAQADYDRKKADLLNIPYMAMPKISWDPEDPTKTYMELDYNEHFINDLAKNGYKGSEEEMVDQWLKDVCSSVLNDMSEDFDFNDAPRQNTRTIKRDDGKTEHL